MTPSSAKNKGRVLCKMVKAILLEWLPLSSKDVEVTSSGAPGIDLKLSPAARKLFPYAVECKNVEKLSTYEAWEQCVANATLENLYPLLIIKRNHKEILAVLSINELMRLIYGQEEVKEAISKAFPRS